MTGDRSWRGYNCGGCTGVWGGHTHNILTLLRPGQHRATHAASIMYTTFFVRRSISRTVCSGSVVVTAYDSESGRTGSNPEWGLISYEASIAAVHRAYPSLHPSGVVHWVPEQLNMKAVTGACKLIDGCSLALCSATLSVVSAGICHRNEVKSIA